MTTTQGKVLIVDDNQEMCELLSKAIAPLGYESTSVNDGVQAIERIEAEKFGVVILDLMMPDTSGIEVLKRIRERQTEVEVVVLTAHASLESATEALRLGAYDYLAKPFDLETIRSVVRRAVEKQHLKTKLVAIHDLSHEMTLSPSVEQVTETVLDIIERVLGFETYGLALVDEDQNELYQLAARGIDVEAILNLPLDGEKGIAVAAARSGEPIYAPDVRDHPEYLAVRTTTQSELAVPLKVKGRVIGVLNVESDEVDAFSQGDAELLSTLAAQAAVAFENARLYEEAQREIAERKRAEVEIKQRNRELTALNEIGQAINSTLDLQKTLTLIADHSIQLLDVEATSVLLYDEDRGDLWFAAASGVGADLVLGQRLAPGQGIAGRVVQHGEPVLIPDVSKDPNVFRGFDKEGIYATHSVMCVPLQSKDRTIGVLEAVNKKSSAFDQEDLRLLGALAELATTAIENARLFEQVSTNRRQLRALSHRLVDVQEAERGRVARELHDETGQALSSLLLGLSLLEGNADDPVAVITRVNELEGLVDRTLENLHRLSMDLRPASLDHLGLVPALKHYVELFNQQHNSAARFETVGLDPSERLLPAVETAIYRIVQEALTNVLRHAQATHVDVLLERRGDRVVTIIEDDGVGFDSITATQSSRLGLFGMQERAEMLGGALTIESSDETGTTIVVEIPDVRRETSNVKRET